MCDKCREFRAALIDLSELVTDEMAGIEEAYPKLFATIDALCGEPLRPVGALVAAVSPGGPDDWSPWSERA